MSIVSSIGMPMRRREDPRLVRGAGCYVGDLRLPDMLFVAFARCPLGHARVHDLSLQRALEMPGVVAAFGPRELPVLAKPMPQAIPQPGVQARLPSPLADGVVRYAGEAVAVVVADDMYRAADAAAAIDVTYDPLPAVVDPVEALREGAPLVHTDVPGNLAGRLTLSSGDVEGAFARADVVIREHFSSERAAGASIEPRGIAAQPGGEGGVALTLWDSTQAPHAVRRGVAQALDLPEERVRVVTPNVGGGFGPKGRLYPEEIVLAALAIRLGRPCLWQATRHEDFLATYQGRGLVVDAELAARADGTLLGLRARLLQDAGAYLPLGLGVAQNSAQHLLGPYRLPAAAIEIVGAYTNKSPLTPLRGGGRELGVFVMERLLDHLARRVGQDPIEVRRRNALRADEFPYDTGLPGRGGSSVVYDSGDYPSYLEKARRLIGYDDVRQAQPAERAAGTYRGVALTLFIESTGMGQETAHVEIGDDGSVALAVGPPDNGQGHPTTLAQVCAARLGVPVERVKLTSGDTGAMAEGTGTFASRTAVVAGNATALAASALRRRVLDAAADLLEAAPEDLEIGDGVVRVRGAPGRDVALGEVARRARAAGNPLAATETFAPERPTAFAGGAHAAVVAVDIETGAVTVERYAVVHDCGTVINPTIVDGQIHGGVAHGLGNALGEMMVYDDAGRLLTGHFDSYVMPRADQLPLLLVEHHACPSPNNPEGIKGAGEAGTIGALATIVGAVEDALMPVNPRLNSLPLRFEDLARLCAPLRSRNSSLLPS